MSQPLPSRVLTNLSALLLVLSGFGGACSGADSSKDDGGSSLGGDPGEGDGDGAGDGDDDDGTGGRDDAATGGDTGDGDGDDDGTGGRDDTATGGTDSTDMGGAGSGAEQGTGGDSGGDVQLEALELSPASIELHSMNGSTPSQAFTLTAKYDDGSRRDVTTEASFEWTDPRLGALDGAVFTAHGRRGGAGTLRASFGSTSTETEIIVDVTLVDFVGATDQETADAFVAAVPDGSLDPELVYPAPDTIAPPTLVELDVHFKDPASTSDAFEVTLDQAYFHYTRYIEQAAGTNHFTTVSGESWQIIRENLEGSSATLSVRSVDLAETNKLGVSLSQTLSLAMGAIGGKVFYRLEDAGSSSGVYRYLMGDGEQAVEPLYTTATDAQGRCVSCHAPSRDGALFASTINGGNGLGIIFNGSGEVVVPTLSLGWNFAAFDPGSSEVLTVKDGVITVRDGLTTNTLGAGPTGATHPAFHPEGTALAYVKSPSVTSDWIFTKGSIVTRSYSREAHAFGPETPLVETTGTLNNYYPAWSPDGEFIAFNRSNGDSYADADAELFVIDAQGESEPISLSLANGATDSTNSRPWWAPGSARLLEEENSERVLWIVFASRRDFGVRLVGAARFQLWLTPFFPERAAAGNDPSGPAVRLPLQNLNYQNYLPTWVE